MTCNPITPDIIQSAEKIIGVSYTPAERELMLDNLDAQIEAARMRRTVSFDNSLPMATRFDPRLSGFTAPTEECLVRGSTSDPGPLPDDEEDIAFAPLTRLSAWIRTGALTSRRLTEIYLKRIRNHGGRLECFITVLRAQARIEADTADRLLANGTWLGPLHGIPYGLKDLFDTHRVRTSWGAMPFKDRVPTDDAHIVKLLRAAGAVLIGKTTVGALAYGDIWFGGTTRNPWNPDEGSSGSSAGSAAATAAGLCGFSIGTETLGSITSPCQRCGTTGLRPTYGRVGRTGGMTLCWSLDKIGPICRSVEDTALVLAAINGFDEQDRGSIRTTFGFDARNDIKGCRIGFLPETFEAEGASDVDRAALAAARELGCEIVEVSLPALPYASLTHILYAEAAACFEELTLSDRDDLMVWQDKHAWPNTFRKARFLSAVDHIQLDRLRYRVMQALDRLFDEVDFMIGPFNTGPMLIASNFTGHPCLHLRAGFIELPTRPMRTATPLPPDAQLPPKLSPVFGVPQGISLWSRLFDEGRLCNLGMALEARLDVAHRRPALVC